MFSNFKKRPDAEPPVDSGAPSTPAAPRPPARQIAARRRPGNNYRQLCAR
jgi:hypothetical protein